MGAREKLNRINRLGAVGIGALAGLIGQSFLLFVAVAATIIALDLYRGRIRPDRMPPL